MSNSWSRLRFVAVTLSNSMSVAFGAGETANSNRSVILPQHICGGECDSCVGGHGQWRARCRTGRACFGVGWREMRCFWATAVRCSTIARELHWRSTIYWRGKVLICACSTDLSKIDVLWLQLVIMTIKPFSKVWFRSWSSRQLAKCKVQWSYFRSKTKLGRDQWDQSFKRSDHACSYSTFFLITTSLNSLVRDYQSCQDSRIIPRF